MPPTATTLLTSAPAAKSLPLVIPSDPTTPINTNTQDPPTPAPAEPKLSSPIIYTCEDLRSNLPLANALKDFINHGYLHHPNFPPAQWVTPRSVRFIDLDALFSTLGENGVFAVITFHEPDDKDLDAKTDGKAWKIAAAAAASTWKGDMDVVDADDQYPSSTLRAGETGWEFKSVMTDSRISKRGVASQCLEALQTYYLEKAKVEGQQEVSFWIHCVDFVNEAYWLRRGWKEVRRHAKPDGFWGSIRGFDLVVMIKVLPVS